MTIKRWDMWSHETCAGLTMSTMTIWLKYLGQGAYMKTSFEFGNQEMYIGFGAFIFISVSVEILV